MKKPPARSLSSGKFEAPTPATDKALFAHAAGVVSAVDTLVFPLLSMAKAAQSDLEKGAALGALRYLVLLKSVYEQSLFPDAEAGPMSPEKVQALVERMQANWSPIFKEGD